MSYYGAWIFGYLVSVGAMVILWAGPSAAAIDAEKCEAIKNKIAGKYAFCHREVEAKAIKTGDPADYSKCHAKFTKKWTIAETIGGGMCPTNGDEGSIQSFISTRGQS